MYVFVDPVNYYVNLVQLFFLCAVPHSRASDPAWFIAVPTSTTPIGLKLRRLVQSTGDMVRAPRHSPDGCRVARLEFAQRPARSGPCGPFLCEATKIAPARVRLIRRPEITLHKPVNARPIYLRVPQWRSLAAGQSRFRVEKPDHHRARTADSYAQKYQHLRCTPSQFRSRQIADVLPFECGPLILRVIYRRDARAPSVNFYPANQITNLRIRSHRSVNFFENQ